MDKDIETMVAEIEARAEKATAGPWIKIGPWFTGSTWTVGITRDGAGTDGVTGLDLEFMRHAREDVPKLCAMWREQQRRIQSHEHWIKEFRLAWDIPKGTTIHEFMKAMAIERDALRERVATLTDLLERVRDLDSLSDLPDLMRPIIKAIGENPDHRR